MKLILAGLLLSVPPLSLAQLQVQAPPAASAGAIVKFNDDSATLKDKDGKEFVVPMTPGWTVSIARTVDSTAIKSGDFVATANAVVDDRTGKSTELRILEPG